MLKPTKWKMLIFLSVVFLAGCSTDKTTDTTNTNTNKMNTKPKVVYEEANNYSNYVDYEKLAVKYSIKNNKNTSNKELLSRILDEKLKGIEIEDSKKSVQKALLDVKVYKELKNTKDNQELLLFEIERNREDAQLCFVFKNDKLVNVYYTYPRLGNKANIKQFFSNLNIKLNEKNIKSSKMYDKNKNYLGTSQLVKDTNLGNSYYSINKIKDHSGKFRFSVIEYIKDYKTIEKIK